MIGKTVLHYKILEKLGAGGMGVVYNDVDSNDSSINGPCNNRLHSDGGTLAIWSSFVHLKDSSFHNVLCIEKPAAREAEPYVLKLPLNQQGVYYERK